MTNLTEFLAIAAARAEGRPALIYNGRAVSHAEIEAESRRVAAGLRGLGIGRGDRVALWMPNAPAYIATFFACARLGAIAMAVNTRFRAIEVADIVGRSGAKALMLWPGFKGIPFLDILAEVDPAALGRVEHLILYSDDGTRHPSPVPTAKAVAYDDLAAAPAMNDDHADAGLGCAIFTTSGTTKAPKFVLHPQSSIAVHGIEVADRFGWRDEGTMILQSLPLCGVFGLSQIMAGLASGRTTVLMPFHDTEEAVRLMIEHRITHTAGSDDMYNMILQAAPGERPFPHFRYGLFGSFNAALDQIAEQADARGVTLTGVYGMSEVQALYTRWDPASPVHVRKRGGGLLTSPTAAVRVRDPESGELLAPGQAGELEARGPSLMMEYFQNPEATAETFTADGFVRTGDLAELTEEGGFVFLSRMGDVLRLGGFLVAPAEIEARVLEHPAVGDVQVVGATVGGRNRAVAFVIPRPGGGFDEQAVIDHCTAGLARYKVPARVIAVDAFPTTLSANGIKIQKAKLRDMAKAATAETAGA
ncbi:MAG: AMP-binding protein [Pseudomonadota bacterium]|nr:AMP-binding protein [Pseudomonadota bacterium]